MNIYGYEPDDRSNRPDPIKLYYRFFAVVAVVLSWLWLGVYRQEVHNAAKLSLVIAGLGWSRVPRLKTHGIGWLIPKFVGLNSWERFCFIVSLLLTIFGFGLTWLERFTLGQTIHWFAGGFAIVAGMDYLLRVSGREGGMEKSRHDDNDVIHT